jgi:hypothetical protein
MGGERIKLPTHGLFESKPITFESDLNEIYDRHLVFDYAIDAASGINVQKASAICEESEQHQLVLAYKFDVSCYYKACGCGEAYWSTARKAKAYTECHGVPENVKRFEESCALTVGSSVQRN